MRISDWSSDVCSSDLEPFLKWCDLWRLSEMMCAPKDLDLQKVVFCTAVPRREHSPGQRDRHNRFNSALISKGVEVLKGDRKSVVQGKSVSVRVDLGGRRIIQKKKKNRR